MIAEIDATNFRVIYYTPDVYSGFFRADINSVAIGEFTCWLDIVLALYINPLEVPLIYSNKKSRKRI